MRRTTLLSLLLATVASMLCFGMLYVTMSAIGQGQIILCWPVYWLFACLSGLMGVCIRVAVAEVQQLRKNR